MNPGGTIPMLLDSDKQSLILMDGPAMVHRAWHAIQNPMNLRSTGEEIRAVYGFLSTFLREIAEWKPTHCAIAFDPPGPTFRHVQFEAYKAHRPDSAPELHAQFARVRQLVEVFNIPIYEVEGFEADDAIGTLARQAEEQGIQTLILTGDTDTLQLVSPLVRVLLSYSIQKRAVYDEAAVRERYGGLGPRMLPDFKALQGDASDNIPGVPGIGEKTAIRLLTDFGSLEGLLERLDEVSPARIQQALRERRDQAIQSKALATISRDIPIKLDLEATRFWRYDRARVVALMRELEFFSMVPRIPEPRQDGRVAEEALAPTPKVRLDVTYTIVDTEEALDAMVRELAASGGFAFDTETTSQDAMKAELVGLSFSNAPQRGWYVPVGHLEGKQLPLDLVLKKVAPLLESEAIPKTAHNANYDMTVLESYGVKVKNLAFDTMIAAHLTGRKALNLKALALDCLREEMTQITELIGSGKKQLTMAQVPIEKAAAYAAADADFTVRLQGVFEGELEEQGLRKLFDELEMPLVPVLVQMQRNGIAMDAALLERMSAELGEQLAQIASQMYELVGHQFNLNSSQQLGDVLFKELRLPPTKRTQTGYTTDAAALDALKEMLDQGQVEGIDPKAYQVLSQILEYRQLAKLKSTYLDALPGLVNPKTGRLYTSYNQTGSATGRVSSNDPNVQNIPVRTELGRRVRKAFIAQEPGWTLLGADYSQIELRILAHLSQDSGLLEAFRKGEDIHSATASSVYGVPISAVTPDMRRIAKIMNFGVLYGLSPFGIRQQTGLTPEDGAKFIETYFGKYPGIRRYIDSVKAQVKEKGYVETVLGRRRYIPEVRSSNFHVRSAGERMAVNMPIQGTAADIIKIAMVRVQERINALKLRSMMIIQVHDELIFESPKEELGQMEALVLELMPSAMHLSVPLNVELKTGPTWGDME
jgi:DNA polymerase-1